MIENQWLREGERLDDLERSGLSLYKTLKILFWNGCCFAQWIYKGKARRMS